VRLALELQDDELAALALRAKIAESPEFGPDCSQCQYLLGVIEERQGASERAIEAFEAAAQRDGALRQDAVTHLIGLELQRKNCNRADQLIAQSDPARSGGTKSVILVAQVDLCQGRWLAATARIRRELSSTRDTAKRAELQVLLAQALVSQTEIGDAERRAAEDEVLELAEQAIAQPNTFDRGRGLLEQLLLVRHRDGQGDPLIHERANLLDALVEARSWGAAQQLSRDLLAEVTNAPNDVPLYCRILFAKGRIDSAKGERNVAIEAFGSVESHCDDTDIVPRALFLQAGLLAAMGKGSAAIAKYAELEQRFPGHRLADDSRLKQAFLYRAIGSESRFVALLDSMPDDYPDGDMVLEGLFQLALKNMLQRNWAVASSVLERSARFVVAGGTVKDVERDRLNYFLGRAALENGRVDFGVKLLGELVIGRPMTYYMLLARGVLARKWPSELERTEGVGMARSGEELSPDPSNAELSRQRIARLSALLGVADLKAADALLDAGESDQLDESTVFAVAGMYANAGAIKTALTLVKRRGRDWRVRWPVMGWVDLWKQAFPRPYHEIVRQQAQKQGVLESLIYAIMREESEFDPKVVSHADAHGLMQLIVPTARTAGRELGIGASVAALHKPSVNIALGTRVLAKLGERFSGQAALVAAGYNAGPGRPARWLREYPDADMDLWIEFIEFPETRGYVKRVLESQAAYRWLYGVEGGAGASIELLPDKLKGG